MHYLISAAGKRILEHLASSSRTLYAFDFDGTLARIVRDRDAARMAEGIRLSLEELTAKAPTAAGHPPSTAPVAASTAAPGVDQATVIGIRYRHARRIDATPIVRHSTRRPLAASRGEAPTASSPVSTTANELVTPTSAVTTPAMIGRDSGAGGFAEGSIDPRRYRMVRVSSRVALSTCAGAR